MNELYRAMRRAKATTIDPPPDITTPKRGKREKLIWSSLKYQGFSDSQIQDKINRWQAIQKMPDHEARPLLEHIVRACCVYFGVTHHDFASADRRALPVRARQVAFYLAKTLTNRNLTTIGNYMNKDRGSVEHGYKEICRKLLDDDVLLNDVEHIKKEIRQYTGEE